MVRQNGMDSVAEQVRSAGHDFKDKANDMASSSADAVKEQASSLTESAKEMVSDATDKIGEAVDEKKHAGADYVGRVAETIRRVGQEIEKEMPLVSPYVRRAATQIETVGTSIRNGNMRDVVDGVQDFAKRQPFAFLSLTALAGFAAVRFIKSAPPSHLVASTQGTKSDAGKGYRDDFAK